MELQKEQHYDYPSRQFEVGDVKDFATAMQVLRKQHAHEHDIAIEISREHYPDQVGKEVSLKHKKMQELEKQIEQAEHIYDVYVKRAIENAAYEMRKTNDPLLKEIADCLETGDYSRLAI